MYKPGTFEINFASALPPPRGTSAVAVCVFADEPQLACDSADERLRRVCADLLSAGEFKGEEDTTLLCHLADDPGGSLPPREFARRVAEMADEFGLRLESLDADEIRARGMGGLWGVGQGSDEPPALIVVRYEPEGARAQDELWAFVGKGITFDTGGISIKPRENMEEMKADMAGGAAGCGALRAIAQLKPRRRIGALAQQVRCRHTLGAPRHRRYRLARRPAARRAQRRNRHRRAHARRISL